MALAAACDAHELVSMLDPQRDVDDQRKDLRIRLILPGHSRFQHEATNVFVARGRNADSERGNDERPTNLRCRCRALGTRLELIPEPEIETRRSRNHFRTVPASRGRQVARG